jgi:arginase
MVRLTVIGVPYAAGRLEEGMGLGPTRYLEAGADVVLAEAGHDVEVVTLRPDLHDTATEPDAVVRIDAVLASAVSEALAAGRFPLVLAGNCNSCLGTLAALQAGDGSPIPSVGIVWFDAHGDLNTPETSPGGFFDGMGLAIATGRAHPEVRRRVGLGSAIPESRVLHLGSRDLDAPESRYLEESAMLSLSADELQRAGGADTLRAALGTLGTQAEGVYLHIDIDVLSGDHAPGVDFPSPGGLGFDELEGAVRAVAREIPVRAAALTAYNPDHERDETTLRSGLRLMEIIAEVV